MLDAHHVAHLLAEAAIRAGTWRGDVGAWRGLHFNPQQARDERGRWIHEGGFLSSPTDALGAITDGVHATVSPEDVRGVLQRAATRSGPIDLTHLTIEGYPIFAGGLSRRRATMPQIDRSYQAAFLASLKNQGISVVRDTARPAALLPVQGEIDAVRVGQMLARYDSGEKGEMRPVMISQDKYVLDGHHRWALMAALDAESPAKNIRIPVIRLSVDHQAALNLMLAFNRQHGVASRQLEEWRAAYDPNQPRDSRGQWTDSYGWSDADTLLASPDVQRGIVISHFIDTYGTDWVAHLAHPTDAERVKFGLQKPIVPQRPVTSPITRHVPIFKHSDQVRIDQPGHPLHGTVVKIDKIGEGGYYRVRPVHEPHGVYNTYRKGPHLGFFKESALKALEYDEAKHPRDEQGRWTDGGGGSTNEVFAPASQETQDHVAKTLMAKTQAEIDYYQKTVPHLREKYYTPDLTVAEIEQRVFTDPTEARARQVMDLARLHYNAAVIQQKKEETSARIEKVTNIATEVAKELGVPPSLMHVVDKDPPTFTVGDLQFKEGGHYTPLTNQIEINARHITSPLQAQTIAAHEATHAMFNRILTEQRNEHDKMQQMMSSSDTWKKNGYVRDVPAQEQLLKNNLASAMFYRHMGDSFVTRDEEVAGKSQEQLPHTVKAERLQYDDGVTSYSKAYWDVASTGTFKDVTEYGVVRERPSATYMNAVNETLAEMSAIKFGQSGLGERARSPLWNNFHADLLSTYKKIRATKG